MQETHAVSGMFFPVAGGSGISHSLQVESAPGMGPYNPEESVRSCWNPTGGRARACLPAAGKQGALSPRCLLCKPSPLVCAGTSPPETLSLDALSTVPLSLILTAWMLCCSHPHALGGIPPGPFSCAGREFCFHSVIIRQTESH